MKKLSLLSVCSLLVVSVFLFACGDDRSKVTDELDFDYQPIIRLADSLNLQYKNEISTEDASAFARIMSGARQDSATVIFDKHFYIYLDSAKKYGADNYVLVSDSLKRIRVSFEKKILQQAMDRYNNTVKNITGVVSEPYGSR